MVHARGDFFFFFFFGGGGGALFTNNSNGEVRMRPNCFKNPKSPISVKPDLKKSSTAQNKQINPQKVPFIFS